MLFSPRPGGVGWGGGYFLFPSSLFAIFLKPLRRSSRNFQYLPSCTFLLHIVSKNCSRAYERLATSDVRVTSCSAIFDVKKGFAGRALMPTVLKIKKKINMKKYVKYARLLSRIFGFFKIFTPRKKNFLILP